MSGPLDVYINGRFLAQPVSGVQRYAREIVRALDGLVAEEGGVRWTLLRPRRGDDAFVATLKAIRTETIPGLAGHAWDQFALARHAADGVLVSLCGTGPLLHPRQLVVIHDAAVFRAPDHFSFRYGALHRTIGRVLARTSRIATVSEFSRRELSEVLRIDAAKILVAPNGAEHLGRSAPDLAVLGRLGIEQTPYFLTVGNQTRNKNISLAIKAFDFMPMDTPARLVVVGRPGAAVFGGSPLLTSGKVIVAGRCNDAELAALYTHATALVFPSIYEGFGIPPLEAMSYGCPVLASTAPAVREVCADAADYFDPRDPEALAEAMKRRLAEQPSRADWQARGRPRLALYSWRDSASLIAARAMAIAASAVA